VLWLAKLTKIVSSGRCFTADECIPQDGQRVHLIEQLHSPWSTSGLQPSE
jgi:hypothetical protein